MGRYIGTVSNLDSQPRTHILLNFEKKKKLEFLLLRQLLLP